MNMILIAVFAATFLLALSKRITALINGFALQSFLLFLLMFFSALGRGSAELYAVAGLLLLLKVLLIPYFLKWLVKKISMEENLGMALNPVLSLLVLILLSCMNYFFTANTIGISGFRETASFVISLSVVCAGIFLMVFRLKALAQVLGLLVMENGLFLAAVTLCGNMPFFVEIAIFFDIFVCALILGIFVYRINELFTHIDVDKLTGLKG